MAVYFGVPDTLRAAIQRGDVASLERVAARDRVDLNAVLEGGLHPLHIAAESDQPGSAAWLLDHGATVDPVTDTRYTPLLIAVHSHNYAVARLLIERGANTRATLINGSNILDVLRSNRNYDADLPKLAALIIRHVVSTGEPLMYTRNFPPPDMREPEGSVYRQRARPTPKPIDFYRPPTTVSQADSAFREEIKSPKDDRLQIMRHMGVEGGWPMAALAQQQAAAAAAGPAAGPAAGAGAAAGPAGGRRRRRNTKKITRRRRRQHTRRGRKI